MRQALRALRARPVFTAVVIATLAVGFGVNAAIFSLVRTVLLTPLPYRDADRLVAIGEASLPRGITYTGTVPANYVEWRDRVTSFEAIAAWRVTYLAVTGQTDRPMRVQGVLGEPAFFSVLGVTPALGRPFTAEDGLPGRDRVVLLSYGFWQRGFGGDPGIVGRVLTIDGTPCTVVGVLPQMFKFLHVINHELDIWRPLVLNPTDHEHSVGLYARLKPSASVDAAQAELAAAYAALRKEEFRDGWTATVAALATRLTENQRPILAALQAAVAVVLCVAAANVATLMLALAAGRRKDVAIRIALGATRGRLTLELGREALLLAGAGAALGALLAVWVVRFLNGAISYQDINRLEPFRVDVAVVGFTLMLAIASAVTFALLPARRAADADVIDALKDSSHGATFGVTHRRLRAALVLSELALSIVLLTSGLELARHALALNSMDRGVDAERVMTAQLSLNGPRYDDPRQMTQFADHVIDRLIVAPGVAAASVVNWAPLSFVATSFPIAIEGRAYLPGQEPMALCWIVAPRYFETVGIPLMAGRDFTRGDTNDLLGVAIASRALAQRFWGRIDVVGERLRVLFPRSDAHWIPRATARPLTIVGVVGDVREDGVGPSEREADPQLYLPYSQSPTRIMTVVARAFGPPESTAPVIRDAVRAADPDQPTFDERSLEDVRQETFSRSRGLAWLVGAFAALALLLAAIGVYGVMAYLAEARRREIAIRLALGGTPGGIVALVVGDAMKLAAAGLVTGVALTPVAMRFAAHWMSGLAALHLSTVGVVVVVLSVVCAVAAAIPAIRVARAREVVALRTG